MTVTRIGLGILTGAVAFVSLAYAQLIGSGLHQGVVVGLDGEPVRLIGAAPLAVVGMVVAGLAVAGFSLLRTLPRIALLAAASAVAVLIAVGTLRFTEDYLPELGMRDWFDDVLVNGSQSLATFLLLGLLLAAAISPQAEQPKSERLG